MCNRAGCLGRYHLPSSNHNCIHLTRPQESEQIRSKSVTISCFHSDGWAVFIRISISFLTFFSGLAQAISVNSYVRSRFSIKANGTLTWPTNWIHRSSQPSTLLPRIGNAGALKTPSMRTLTCDQCPKADTEYCESRRSLLACLAQRRIQSPRRVSLNRLF